MKTVGIIAEYNPFHSGHQYHIEMAKKITDADFCVAVMSGDFVQRGEPAIFKMCIRDRLYPVYWKSPDGNESGAYFCLHESEKTG